MKSWREILIKPDDSVETAIKVLHMSGNRIVLVVDKNRRLVGTITDGDIRRALLKHLPMQTEIKRVLNSQPVTAKVSTSKDSILAIMKQKDLLHVPLVDNDGVLVGLETLSHLISNSKHDNPVFIMAGGYGKRLHPLTEETPKPMLKLGDKPILETILLQFRDSGFENFYFSTHYKAEMIHEYFGDGSKWGCNIEYIHESTPLGTAGSLSLLRKEDIKKPIVIMNGDLLTKVNFNNLINYHREHEGTATVCVREYDFQVPYGVIQLKGSKVTEIEEKPVQRFFVNAGIYVLNPELVNEITEANYLDMPNLLENAIETGREVFSFPIHEYWMDIGRIEDFKQASRDFFEIV